MQRLQIAQLLLSSESVLIFDESTKGLDQHNEEAVMVNILAHVKQRKKRYWLLLLNP